MRRREFRTDVQSLRAVAVMAVVVFHLWPAVLPGGYVGVDAFFVISGYLITSHLFRQIERTGRVQFLDFYARRIRRLLPASYLVLLVSLVLVVTVMPRAVWHDNLAEIGGAAAYVVNWLLAFMQVDYLAQDNSPGLVQHYWSLSLEEQFYVVWPALLVVSVWLVAKVTPRVSRRAVVVAALVAVGVASLAFSVYYTAQRPEVAFFVTPTRVWQFAVGGLVGFLPVAGRSARARAALAWLGLVVLVGSCFVIDEDAAFPGWIALVPTLSAALVIAGGDLGGRTSVAAATRWSPIQWLGDHSYSIYLWHWPPIIALPWIVHGTLGNGLKVAVLVGTLALAWLTKTFVEDPVRTGAWWRLQLRRSYAFAAVGAVLLLAGSVHLYRGLDSWVVDQRAALVHEITQGDPCFGAAAMVNDCPDPYQRPSDDRVDVAAADVPPAEHTCQVAPWEPAAPRWCEFGDLKDPTQTVAIVGNSYAVQFVPMLQQWGADRGLKIMLAARTDCLGLSTTPVTGQRADDPCVGWSRAVQQRLLATPDLTAVIFVSHEGSHVYLTGQPRPTADAQEQARTHVADSLQKLKDAGIPTMVVKHAPGTRPVSAPECVALSPAGYDPCPRDRAAVTKPDLLASLAESRPDLTQYVTVDRYFCDEQTCHAAIGGILAYYDDHHISETYARTMAPFLAPELEALVSRRG